MTTRNPRIQVSLNPDENAIIQEISKKKKISKSLLIKKIVEDWVEEYEDALLSKALDDIASKYEKGELKTISHEEMWKRLGI